jgi:predicted Ser/Thr protein kinase
MCHQKIAANEKYGALPMNYSTINEVYNAVKKSDFPSKKELLNILTKWKKGDFSTVDHDHDYVLVIQEGTIGYSSGKLSPEAEAQFILVNFGSKLD